MKKKLIELRKAAYSGMVNIVKHQSTIRFIEYSVRDSYNISFLTEYSFLKKQEKQLWLIIYIDLLIISMK